MALFLGNSKKLQVNLNGVSYYVRASFDTSNIIRLLSSENYILKDSAGFYLVPKKEPEYTQLLSLDNYILMDNDGLYLVLDT
jgi:hypothetical protein